MVEDSGTEAREDQRFFRSPPLAYKGYSEAAGYSFALIEISAAWHTKPGVGLTNSADRIVSYVYLCRPLGRNV